MLKAHWLLQPDKNTLMEIIDWGIQFIQFQGVDFVANSASIRQTFLSTFV